MCHSCSGNNSPISLIFVSGSNGFLFLSCVRVGKILYIPPPLATASSNFLWPMCGGLNRPNVNLIGFDDVCSTSS